MAQNPRQNEGRHRRGRAGNVSASRGQRFDTSSLADTPVTSVDNRMPFSASNASRRRERPEQRPEQTTEPPSGNVVFDGLFIVPRCLLAQPQPHQSIRQGTAEEPEWIYIEPTPIQTLIPSEFLTLSLKQAAQKAYFEVHDSGMDAQLQMLTCAVLANPQMTDFEQCQREAKTKWNEMYREKILEIRQRYRVEPLVPTEARDNLYETLTLILSRSNAPNPAWSSNDHERWKVQFRIEMLRWAASEMSALTAACDRYRVQKILESGIRFKVIGGFFVDLVNVIYFRWPPA